MKNLLEKIGMIRVIHANGLWNEYSDVIIEIVYYLWLYLVNKCYINNHSNEEFENFLETKPSGWVSTGLIVFCRIIPSGVTNISSSEDDCVGFLFECGEVLSLIFILLITLFRGLPLNTCSTKINLKMEILLLLKSKIIFALN